MLIPCACTYRYSLAALSAASHEHELVPDSSVHVHLDVAHMGLGGDDSWSPSVREVSKPEQLPPWSGEGLEPAVCDFIRLTSLSRNLANNSAKCTRYKLVDCCSSPWLCCFAGVPGSTRPLCIQLLPEACHCWRARPGVRYRRCGQALAVVVSVRAQLTAHWRHGCADCIDNGESQPDADWDLP